MSELIIFSEPCPNCDDWVFVESREEPTQCFFCKKYFEVVTFWDASEDTLVEMLEEVEDVQS